MVNREFLTKKRYKKPQIFEHGDINKITRGNGPYSSDGPDGPFDYS